MHFSKSLQGSKKAITMRPVPIELTLLLFLLIQKFLDLPKTMFQKQFHIYLKKSCTAEKHQSVFISEAVLFFCSLEKIFLYPTSLCLSSSGRFLYCSQPYFYFCSFLQKDFYTVHEYMYMYIFVSVEKKQALPLNEHCVIKGSKSSSKVSAVYCVKSARIRRFLIRISRIRTECRDLRSKSYISCI